MVIHWLAGNVDWLVNRFIGWLICLLVYWFVDWLHKLIVLYFIVLLS